MRCGSFVVLKMVYIDGSLQTLQSRHHPTGQHHVGRNRLHENRHPTAQQRRHLTVAHVNPPAKNTITNSIKNFVENIVVTKSTQPTITVAARLLSMSANNTQPCTDNTPISTIRNGPNLTERTDGHIHNKWSNFQFTSVTSVRAL